MNKILTIILYVLMSFSVLSGEVSVPQHLQDISVTIKAEGSSGSGVIFTRKDKNGNFISFVWTAAHVIDSLRYQREIIDSGGNKKVVVEFKDAQILKLLIEEGRIIGRLSIDAAIIKYSDSNFGHDVGILKVRKKNFTTNTVEFYLKDDILSVGIRLYHCASLLGEYGQSLTDGILSQNGRLVNGKEYTQSTLVALSGSSGGGVYLQDNGLCVGFILRGASDVMNLYCPINRIKKWAIKNNVLWTLNPSIEMPSEEELQEMPIEDKIIKEKNNKN